MESTAVRLAAACLPGAACCGWQHLKLEGSDMIASADICTQTLQQTIPARSCPSESYCADRNAPGSNDCVQKSGRADQPDSAALVKRKLTTTFTLRLQALKIKICDTPGFGS
jgi:hypothetical protein